ncbi:kappa-casein [Dipodomys spectabilis]|uniref:kappa-casein n=1 Tax=Dipodomys spectabilis TaxID=105255 RepID=UPI001C542C91|nr:kappa-casein [Dipodomys spectabilis]
MMKSFLLAVNILALTLPFLAAQVQHQEPACHKNDGRLFEQKKVLYIPMHYVLRNNPLLQPNFYQRIVPINSPYMPFPYYAVNNLPYTYYTKQLLLGPHVPIARWQALPNIFQPTTEHQTFQHASFMATPPQKNQDENTVLPIDNTATVEPTPVSATEVAAHIVEIPQASSELDNTPETTVVPVTPTAA